MTMIPATFSTNKGVLTAEQAPHGWCPPKTADSFPKQSFGVVTPLLRLRRELVKILKRIFTLPLARRNKTGAPLRITMRVLIVLIFVSPLVFAVVAPSIARGTGMPVFDATNLVPNTATAVATGATAVATADIAANTSVVAAKEGFLDGLAYGLVRIAMNKFTNGIVLWIRSGYDGKPGFLTDQDAFFRDLGNEATGVFINQIGANDILCKPWEFVVKIGLQFQKPYRLKAKCTLLDAEANFKKMSENFMAAGWEGFLQITAPQQNNPYGAFLQAQSELAVRVGAEQERKKDQLIWGSGYFPITKKGGCIETDLDGNCVQYAPDKVVTPGALVKEALNQTSMDPIWQARFADEIDEAASIIVGEMIMQAINPNRGLANIDDVPFENTAKKQIDKVRAQASSGANGPIVTIDTYIDTKRAAEATIGEIRALFGELVGGSVPFVSADAVKGNASCLGTLFKEYTDTGNTASATRIRGQIETLLGTSGPVLVVQNIGVGVSENIDSALAVRNSVSGWQTELNNPAISPDRVIELTNLIQTLDLSARGINQGEANSQSSRL